MAERKAKRPATDTRALAKKLEEFRRSPDPATIDPAIVEREAMHSHPEVIAAYLRLSMADLIKHFSNELQRGKMMGYRLANMTVFDLAFKERHFGALMYWEQQREDRRLQHEQQTEVSNAQVVFTTTFNHVEIKSEPAQAPSGDATSPRDEIRALPAIPTTRADS